MRRARATRCRLTWWRWWLIWSSSIASRAAGGIYHGKMVLPAEYPFKPPEVRRCCCRPGGERSDDALIAAAGVGVHAHAVGTVRDPEEDLPVDLVVPPVRLRPTAAPRERRSTGPQLTRLGRCQRIMAAELGH